MQVNDDALPNSLLTATLAEALLFDALDTDESYW
jgi:hypothetical protein